MTHMELKLNLVLMSDQTYSVNDFLVVTHEPIHRYQSVQARTREIHSKWNQPVIIVTNLHRLISQNQPDNCKSYDNKTQQNIAATE